jgi:phosphonate transport system ATP-binding protein
MYRLENLCKVFNDHLVAVDEVSMKIAAGEQVAIIGPSGAGKTTLFRLLNLTLRPDGGALWFGDLDVGDLHGRALRATRRRIGTIYQQHNLVPRLPVVHNVLAGRLGVWSAWRAVSSLVRPQEIDTAYAAISQVGIPEKLYARTDELSGGQQQRVAIARVLVQDPEVILADEPVASVDPSLAHAIVRLLVEISRTSGKTLVMNLHSVELALTYFPRVIGFREGRIQFDRPPVELSEEHLSGLYAGVSRSETQEAGVSAENASPFTSACGPLLPGK